MQNKKNEPASKQGQGTAWEVGVTSLGDIFFHFSNSEQHFRCTVDDLSAEKIGEALLDTVSKRAAGQVLSVKGGKEGKPN